MSKTKSPPQSPRGLRFDFTPQEILTLFEKGKTEFEAKLAFIAAASPAKFETTFLVFDRALGELYELLGPLLFLKDVSPDSPARDASSTISEKFGHYVIEVYAREDLFRAFKAVETSKLSQVADRRLCEEVLNDFRRNGLDLPPETRKTFVAKKIEIITRQESFQRRIREMSSQSITLKAEDLKGLSPEFISQLAKDGADFKLPMNKSVLLPFMENASQRSARKKVEAAFNRLGGAENVADLEAVIKLRAETAKLLGYPTHAAFVLDRQMAKNPEDVFEFLRSLVKKIQPQGLADLKNLTAQFRKDNPSDPDQKLNLWDWRYYYNQIRKNEFAIDNQKVKEYFPLALVLEGMFELYQTLFGVTFEPVPDAPVWHESVVLHEIQRHGKPVAYFFMDLYPRDNKYNHFAAFDIIRAYQKNDGSYRFPISSIVGNFSAPTETSPSLLEHTEVETLFHEFGHIMHQTLTNAKYTYFSGTSVKTDFVEAPSQMLENWVWQPSILNKISGHYKDSSQKLPPEMIKQMIASKQFCASIHYLRQATFALIDMTYHTENDLGGRSTEIYRKITEENLFMPIQDGTFPQASFGHLMGGYDSGYYGYLWSEVFAQDMFTRFEKEGLENPKTGLDYVKLILEPGGVPDPMEQIKTFLGRNPSQEPFLKGLGL